jgi:carbonic anhydrase/acetyltransferase-like protein (isoleucine patch superfamily)
LRRKRFAGLRPCDSRHDPLDEARQWDRSSSPYRNRLPRIDPSAFVAPGALIIGDVEIGAYANIWFNCVLRGDDAAIRIGAGANIQDGTIIHVTVEEGPAGVEEHVDCVIGEARRSVIWRCCTRAGWNPGPLSG